MLYKRSTKPGAHWWVRFEVRGTEVRQSSGTNSKERAQAFERDLRNAIWDKENLDYEAHTWEEACERWRKEKAHKRSLKRDEQAIRRLSLSGELSDVLPGGSQDLESRGGHAVGAREKAVYRSILNACVRWGWLDKAPKVEMPHEEKHEPRWITQEEFEKLKRELPPHAQAIAAFAVYTGLRSANIKGLKWEVCDLGKGIAYVGSRNSKSGRPIGVPMSRRALAVLRSQVGAHDTYVFTDDRGRAPIGSIKTCWGKAVERSGLPGFRFHDLRHTWAAWHTLRGTPPIILKELGGWSSLAMVERYSALNPGHLADWADNSRTKTGTRKRRKVRKRLKR